MSFLDERTYPLYKGKSVASNINPPSTIYIVTGAAGSPEMHEGFDNKQPTWSAFRSNTLYVLPRFHGDGWLDLTESVEALIAADYFDDDVCLPSEWIPAVCVCETH